MDNKPLILFAKIYLHPPPPTLIPKLKSHPTNFIAGPDDDKGMSMISYTWLLNEIPPHTSAPSQKLITFDRPLDKSETIFDFGADEVQQLLTTATWFVPNTLQ